MVFCFAYNLQLRHIALKQREKLFFLKKKKNAFELCRSDLSRGKCHFIGIFFFFEQQLLFEERRVFISFSSIR